MKRLIDALHTQRERLLALEPEAEREVGQRAWVKALWHAQVHGVEAEFVPRATGSALFAQ